MKKEFELLAAGFLFKSAEEPIVSFGPELCIPSDPVSRVQASLALSGTPKLRALMRPLLERPVSYANIGSATGGLGLGALAGLGAGAATGIGVDALSTPPEDPAELKKWQKRKLLAQLGVGIPAGLVGATAGFFGGGIAGQNIGTESSRNELNTPAFQTKVQDAVRQDIQDRIPGSQQIIDKIKSFVLPKAKPQPSN